MHDHASLETPDPASRIARLVEERGWNQEDFARAAHLNRHTVHQILHPVPNRQLRNGTIRRCAEALHLTVNELKHAPLDELLQRIRSHDVMERNGDARVLYEVATQPELLAWTERNPERAKQLTEIETDELLSLQGTGGPLTRFGVDHFVDIIERKRRLIEDIHAIAGTEYLPFLEQFVRLLHEKIQPYRDRVQPTLTNVSTKSAQKS